MVYNDPTVSGDGSLVIGTFSQYYNRSIAEAALATFATKHNIAVRLTNIALDRADETTNVPLLICNDGTLRNRQGPSPR